jgi:hypothetical protein
LSPQTKAQQEEAAEAKKRSEAAKKAAATRKKNEEEEAKKAQAAKKANGDDKGSEEKSGEEGPIPNKFSQEPPPEIHLPSPEELLEQEHEMRVAHNERTGGGDVQKDELQAQRDEHNRRTAGIGL